MSRAIDNNTFPAAMEAKLRRIRWRQAGLAVVRAVAIAASVLIAAMLCAMLADWWFTLFHTGLRTALTVTTLSLALAVFLVAGIRPVIDALGWTRAANEADAEVPQLEERWTTISHFANSDRQPDTATSQAMLRQVASEAVALEKLVEPARVVRAARLKKVLIAAAASAAVLAGFLAVNWEQNSVLLRRFWAPTTAITATQLESVTGDAAIPRGETIDITTKLTGLERGAATLTLVTESGETSALVLDADPQAPRQFTHWVDVDESFRYRVSAGDGRTRWHAITAVDPPQISDVRLTVTAPEYVDRPPYEKSLLPGRIKAIQGSRLTLEMRSAGELERFELLLTRDDESGQPLRQVLVLTAAPDGWYRFETLLDKDLALSPSLHSPYGLTNEDRRVCRIRVIPDKAPVARVISPTEEMSVGPDEVLDIKFEAHDDHGIAKAELMVYEESEDGQQELLRVQEIPLDDQRLQKHILAEVQLDLGELALDEGANISYAVRVTDNRMLNLEAPQIDSQQRDGGESADGEPPGTHGNEKDASATAKSKEPMPSDQEGESPDETTIAQAAEGSPSARSGEPTPAESPLAKTDDAAGAAAAQGDEAATSDKPASKEKLDDPAPAVAESGKEGLRVGKEKEQPPAAVATAADGEADTAKPSEPAGPDSPASAVASQSDAPMPAAEAKASPDAVSAAADSPAEKSPPAAAAELADEAESPAVAAAADQPAEDAAQDDPAPNAASAGSPSPGNANPQSSPGNGGSSPRPRDEDLAGQPGRPADADEEQPARDPRSPSGSVEFSETAGGPSQTSGPPLDLDRTMKFETQRGQNAESNRLRLKIIDRLAVAAAAGASRRSDTMNVRQLLARIDRHLAAAETTLGDLNERPDLAAVPEKSQRVDFRLAKAELMIADLRQNSNETKYEFVGLQMVDIGRTHVTPARDRMFVLIQDPGANPARNILRALHHTSAARELLAALTKQFEEVARERELAEALEEAAKMFEVYIENTRGVLREAQRNQNPLRRKMAIIDVDEAYLERLAQVLEMEREIMAEFARILSDDPRLLGKYMDIIKRRDGNLRDRLTDLHEIQEEIAYEVSGWLRVDDAQRPDVWIQVAEMRLLAAKDLVKAASQLEARTQSQLPLNLDPQAGIGHEIVQHAQEVALQARQSALTANQLMNDGLENEAAKRTLVQLADELRQKLTEFDAALEWLAFQREEDEEAVEFTTQRLAESRGLAELAIAWGDVVAHVQHARFHGLAAVDQQALAVDTDRLRVDMASIENDLTGLFQPDDVPAEVTNTVRELMMVMETITFNQAAAAFELNRGRLPEAEAQQTLANEGFARAEQLFDKMRRTTADILDEREVRNPTAADLQDPTLDDFLERLEREPNLNQLLGIPDRPRNLRVIRDWMLWQSQGGQQGAGSAQQAAANAMQRAQMLAQRRSGGDQERRPGADDGQLTEDELKKFAAAENMEEDMEKMLRAIEEKMKDPATPAGQRQELEKKARLLAQMLQEARSGDLNREKWEELANADEMKAMMQALASGEPIPDSQWNRLLSTLDSGLWQVRGRTPPEDYRKSIEQYQDLLRRFVDEESLDAN